jgi:dephospho-CoA kinase
MLRRLRVPVHDADATVHRLMAPGGAAVAAVAKAFPDTRGKDRGIDRAALGRRAFADAKALTRLERILHPLVRQSQQRFLAAARGRREPLVVLDVPLLFEGGGEARCDKVLVVSAPAAVQRARVMARPGMTEARFRAILAKQMPDREKGRRADYVVPTGLGRALTYRKLKQIVRQLRHDAACATESRAAH